MRGLGRDKYPELGSCKQWENQGLKAERYDLRQYFDFLCSSKIPFNIKGAFI